MATQTQTIKQRNMSDRIAELVDKQSTAELGGGKARIEAQTKAGKLTARDRVTKLVDRSSFEEIGQFARHRATYFGMADKDLPADGVVTGSAMVDGRLVHLASQDFTVAGETGRRRSHADKIAYMMRLSLKTGSPFVFINDSGGARVQEGIDSLAAYGRVFYNNVMLSGSVPQISLICGPCAGGAALCPCADRFHYSNRTGSDVHYRAAGHQEARITGEDVTAEQLGGPHAQMNKSGVVHLVAKNDEGNSAVPQAAKLHALK